MNIRVFARARASSDELHVVPRRDVEAAVAVVSRILCASVSYSRLSEGHEAARGPLRLDDAAAAGPAPALARGGFLYADDDRMPAEMRVLHDACAMHVPKAEPDAAGACQHHRSVSYPFIFYLGESIILSRIDRSTRKF